MDAAKQGEASNRLLLYESTLYPHHVNSRITAFGISPAAVNEDVCSSIEIGEQRLGNVRFAAPYVLTPESGDLVC